MFLLTVFSSFLCVRVRVLLRDVRFFILLVHSVSLCIYLYILVYTYTPSIPDIQINSNNLRPLFAHLLNPLSPPIDLMIFFI